MRSLFDLNVVIALIDPHHTFHSKAHRFWKESESKEWASCPLVENGVVRVLSGATYPGASAYSSEDVFDLLRTLINGTDHEFWADEISLLDEARFDTKRILGPKQLTDIYLLGLAAANGGRLVTFDRKITPSAIFGATEENLVVI
ncbi:MAG TPA: TA system VapC family ribonuclease toxin [Pyrinomonadaceae bacterium]